MNQLNYQDIIKNQIHEITGFDTKYIKLICSSKDDINSKELDKHEFSYKNKVYILIKNKLITK